MRNIYPYTDAHELNLDYILLKIKELAENMGEFIHYNQIKIGGIWDISREYEAWTFVTKGNIGYISLKNVPAGTLLGNTEYWAVLFNYANITTLSNAIIIGDSYATLGSSWVDTMQSILRFASCENLAVSGTGFDRGGYNGFLAQLQSYTGDKTEITDIIICGGANDAENRSSSNMASLRSAAVDALEYAKENYPNSRIHLGFIGGCLATSSYASSHDVTMMGWALYAYKEAANIAGVHYLDNVEYAIRELKLAYSADGLHPSTTGSQIIGRAVAAAVKNTFAPYQAKYPTGLDAYTDFDSITGSPDYEVTGENTQINIDQIVVQKAGGMTVAGNTLQYIGTMTTLVAGEPIEYDAKVMFNNFNSINYQWVLCTVQIYGERIAIKPKEMKSDGSGYEDYTAVSDCMIVIEKASLTVPTIAIN